MPAVTETYDRNLRIGKFYPDSRVGKSNYNPLMTLYYGSDGMLVRVEETWRDVSYIQVISGSNYAQNWPDYDYTEVIYPWEETTVSG